MITLERLSQDLKIENLNLIVGGCPPAGVGSSSKNTCKSPSSMSSMSSSKSMKSIKIKIKH